MSVCMASRPYAIVARDKQVKSSSTISAASSTQHAQHQHTTGNRKQRHKPILQVAVKTCLLRQSYQAKLQFWCYVYGSVHSSPRLSSHRLTTFPALSGSVFSMVPLLPAMVLSIGDWWAADCYIVCYTPKQVNTFQHCG